MLFFGLQFSSSGDSVIVPDMHTAILRLPSASYRKTSDDGRMGRKTD